MIGKPNIYLIKLEAMKLKGQNRIEKNQLRSPMPEGGEPKF
jgi:hypothetical protein